MRSERANLRPERADFRPDRADLKPERPDLRPERLEKLWRGGRTDGRTYVIFSPCVLQDFAPFGAAAQKAGIWYEHPVHV